MSPSYNYTAVGPGPDHRGPPPTPGLEDHQQALSAGHFAHITIPITTITGSNSPSPLNHDKRREANKHVSFSTACLTRGGECGYPEQSGAAGPSSSTPDASTGSALRGTVLSAESTNPRSSSPANSGSSSPANPFTCLPMTMPHRALERFNRCLSPYSCLTHFREVETDCCYFFRSYHAKHLQPDLRAKKLRLRMVCKTGGTMKALMLTKLLR